VSTASTMATSDDSSGGSLSASGYCGEAKQLDAKLKSELSGISADASAPTKLKQLVTDEQAAIAKAVSDAPSEIKSDMETIQAAVTPFFQTLQKYDYSLAKAAPHLDSQSFDSPKVKAATARVQAWAKANHCTNS
jgi:dienelactone hydrolase